MQSINLQITPSGVMPVVNASQYDYGRLVQFNLFDGASAYIPPEGTEIRVEGRKSDGTVFSYFANYVGNAVIVTLTQQMTVLAEDVPCELRLNVNNEDIGTINFTLAVEPSNIGMAVVSETEIPAIIALARRQELNAEAWANGTRGGVPVSPDDPAYENNAKYWAEHANLGTLENLLDVDVDNLINGQIIKYNSETGKWENADEEGGGASSLGDLSDVSLNSPSNKQVLMYNYLLGRWENGDAPSGGMTSHIIVESEAGESSVTVTLPSGTVKTCTQVSGSTTQWETTSDEYGTHIIDAYKDGDDAQAQLNIQYVGEYLVHDEHYFHTINVTVKAGASIVITGNGETYGGTGTGSALAFAVHGKEATYTVTTSIDGVSAASQTVTTPATTGQSTSLTFAYGTINLTYANDFRGLSITCSDGNKTITKTAPSGANIMSFYPPNTGTWIISGTVSGQPYSTEAIVVDLAVAVTANIQTVPDGSTVTPTDDIQTWLACAGITDKNYTTLAEVLADSTTLAALIADNNATDYLKRSKSWALSEVPKMTSNTTPSGEAFGISYKSDESDYSVITLNNDATAYYAFDRDNTTYPESRAGYDFGAKVTVESVSVCINANRVVTCDIWASNDKTSNYVLVESFNTSGVALQTETHTMSNLVNYRYWFIVPKGEGGFREVQFNVINIPEDSTAMSYIGLNNYCANTLLADSDWAKAICVSNYSDSVMNVHNPNMSSNTTPSGYVASASSVYSSQFPAYQAFDGTGYSWCSDAGSSFYVRLKFAEAIIINAFKMIVNHDDVNQNRQFNNWKIQGSNDASNWTDLYTSTELTVSDVVYGGLFNNSTPYLYYQLYIIKNATTKSYSPEIEELRLYSRVNV